MEFVHPTTDPTPAQPRNIDAWRAHAAKKKAAGQPFFSTSPRVPAPSFETTSTVRGAAAGPPNIRNPFDDKSTLATDEMLAEWTLQKEAGNVHFSSGEYKEASKTYMETLQAKAILRFDVGVVWHWWLSDWYNIERQTFSMLWYLCNSIININYEWNMA